MQECMHKCLSYIPHAGVSVGVLRNDGIMQAMTGACNNTMTGRPPLQLPFLEVGPPQHMQVI